LLLIKKLYRVILTQLHLTKPNPITTSHNYCSRFLIYLLYTNQRTLFIVLVVISFLRRVHLYSSTRLSKDREKRKTFRWHFLTFFEQNKKTFQINSSRVKTHAHALTFYLNQKSLHQTIVVVYVNG